MIKIAVVDDVQEVCSQVENYIIEIAKHQGVSIDTEVYYSGDQLCDHLKNGEFFDLIFLDIEIGNLSGIDVSDILRNSMKNESTQIAYISGKKDYALEIFDFYPLYFLQKPLDKAKIEKVFLKLINRLHLKREAFSFKCGTETLKTAIKDIIYFESDNHQIIIHYYVQNTYKRDVFYGILDNIEEQLKTERFLRIHKTYYVNPIHIRKYSYDKVQMSNETVLPIAQSKRKEIRALQLKYDD